MKRNGLMLAGLFMLALPLFMWVRWSPEAFVHERLKAADLDETFSFEHMETSWFPGIHVHRASVNTKAGMEVPLGDIWLAPAWGEILRVKPAIHLCNQSQQQPFNLNLLFAEDGVRLRDMDVEIDASRLNDSLTAVAKGVELSLHGRLNLQGGIDISVAGEPTWVNGTLVWKAGGIGIAGQQPYDLGDYVLTLKSDNVWQWSLKGGEQLAVSGSGTLIPAGVNPGLWAVRGELQLGAEGTVGGMLAMISGGSKHATAALSGSLANPKVQWRK